MLIYFYIFYVSAVQSLNIPKLSTKNDLSDSDQDDNSITPSDNDSDISIDYFITSPSNSINNESQHHPLINYYSSGTSATESALESEYESSTSNTSQSSGSYSNFSTLSTLDVSTSSASEISIERSQVWSMDSLTNNTSDELSLSSLEHESDNDLQLDSDNTNSQTENATKEGPNTNKNFFVFNFNVEYERNNDISKIDESIEFLIGSMKNRIIRKQEKKFQGKIELKPNYNTVLTSDDKESDVLKEYERQNHLKGSDAFTLKNGNSLKNVKLVNLLRTKRNSAKDGNEFDTTKKEGKTVERVSLPGHFEEKKIGFESTISVNPEIILNANCPTNSEFVKKLKQLDQDLEQPVWHSNNIYTGAYSREELQVVEVKAEKTFVSDRPVVEWVSQWGGKEGAHAVARGSHGLTLLTSNTEGIHIDYLDFDEPISSMSMFESWNVQKKFMETGLVIAQDSVLHWYQIEGDSSLTQLWSWTLYESIKHLTIYKMEGHWKVATTSYDDVISIFGMNLWENWWLEQHLRGSGKPVIINDGNFIAVIQNDGQTVSVFKYNPTDRMYSCFQNITSPGIMDVTAFTAGPYSFIAIGGDKSAIFQIKGDKFIEKAILNYQLDHVELWLPIKLGYYRNDVLLLFQHRLDHYSHSSLVLEALQWDGDNFVLLEHSPCKTHDEEMFGFTCILDAEGENGLRGASSFNTMQGHNYILTASEELSPIMFQIKTDLIQLIDPIQQEIQNILFMKKGLQNRLLNQQKILEDASTILSHNFQKNIEVLTADNWKINELHTPIIRVNEKLKDFLERNGQVSIAGQAVNNIDFNIDMSQLFDEIKSNHFRIKALVHKLENAVKKKEGLPKTLHNVIIKGGINVKGKTKINNAQINILNGLQVDNVYKNSVMKPKNGSLMVHGKKIIRSLKTRNLQVEKLNGVDIVNPLKNVKPLLVEGNLEILSHLHVVQDIILEGGLLNGIDLTNDIYTTNNKPQTMTDVHQLNFDSIKVLDKLLVENTVNGFNFTEKGLQNTIEGYSTLPHQTLFPYDDLTIDSLTVGNDFNFNYINGRPWKDFIDRVIMKNQDMFIEQLRVNGKIMVESLTINVLNSLKFPQDFLLTNETSASIILAYKNFTTPVRVEAMDCEGAINGIQIQDIVTLSSNQNLNNFTFYDLTVTERLNVTGDITGKELDAYLSNPLLTETNNIKSNVIFRNLVVDGDIVVRNRINGTNWKNIFQDVVAKSSKPLVINSLKTFEGNIYIENDLNVQSGFINNRKIKEFLTIDTEQILPINELHGNVLFDNLQVGGLFDGVNISELAENSIMLSGDQTVNTDIMFQESGDIFSDGTVENQAFGLKAKSIQITQACNDWLVTDALYTKHDITLNNPEFDKLYVDQLIIDGNINTSFSVSGVYLDDFNSLRLSKTEYREITAPYNILEAKMSSLNFNYLNGQTKEDLSSFVSKLDNIHRDIAAGNVNIRNLQVNGELDISRINHVDLHQLAEDAVWLKEDNYISQPITFIDQITVMDLQLLGNVNNKHFENFISDIVHSTDNSVIFTGKKTYVKGLDVKGNLVTNFINNIPVQNLFDTKNDQTLEGITFINGDVNVFNLKTNGIVNDVSTKFLSDLILFAENDEYHLRRDVWFADGTSINNFTINGLINAQYNPVYFLNSVAHINKNNYFKNTITFNGPIKVRNNLDIANFYNGVNVGNLVANMVFVNKDAVIHSLVEFRNILTVDGVFNIVRNLDGNTIQGCEIENWKRSAVYLNQWQKVTGRKHFHNLTINNNIFIEYINNFATSNIIKKGDYNFADRTVTFEHVFVDKLIVNGTINAVDFQKECQNYLMKDGDQIIEAPTYFHSNISITNNANIKMLNYDNFHNLVTVESDVTLLGNYFFHGNTTFENNLNISGTVSNIDMKMWLMNAVFTNDYGDSNIRGKWNISGDVTYNSDVTGSGVVNSFHVKHIAEYLKTRSNEGSVYEQQTITKYKHLCSKLNYIVDVLNSRISIFKNIEEVQIIPMSSEFHSHHFQHGNESFMITSMFGSCTSDLWKWDETSRRLIKIYEFETGCVASWHNMELKASTYLVSSSLETCGCTQSGLELWNFDGYILQHINSFAPDKCIQAMPNDGLLYCLKSSALYMYKILNTDGRTQLLKKESWSIDGAPLRFFPYKTNSVLLTDGQNIYRMYGSTEPRPPKSGFKVPIAFQENKLTYVDEVTELTAGIQGKKLIAAVWSNTSSNDGSITIYEDIFQARVFQKLSAYRPSSLKIINLDQYQTIIVFIENFQAIKMYAYQGIQGFKFWHSLDVDAKKLKVLRVAFDSIPCLIVSGNKTTSIRCFNMLRHAKRHINIQCYF